MDNTVFELRIKEIEKYLLESMPIANGDLDFIMHHIKCCYIALQDIANIGSGGARARALTRLRSMDMEGG